MLLSSADADRLFHIQAVLVGFLLRFGVDASRRKRAVEELRLRPAATQAKVREILTEDPNRLAEFAALNPAALKPADLAVAAGWRAMRAGRFIFLGQTPEHALFVPSPEGGPLYGVIGVEVPFESFLGPPPLAFDGALLPFEGKIVCDGLVDGKSTPEERARLQTAVERARTRIDSTAPILALPDDPSPLVYTPPAPRDIPGMFGKARPTAFDVQGLAIAKMLKSMHTAMQRGASPKAGGGGPSALPPPPTGRTSMKKKAIQSSTDAVEKTPVKKSAAKKSAAKKKAAPPSDAAKAQAALDAVLALVDPFCHERLNREYAAVCRKLAEKLARKRPSPLLSGKPNGWAAGVVRAVGFVNFLQDPSRKPFMKTADIDAAFGVSEATGGGKSLAVRKLFKMHQFDVEWTLPSFMDENPLAWMVMVDGFVQDVRTLPRAVQEAAFRRGMIPYLPSSSGSDSDS